MTSATLTAATTTGAGLAKRRGPRGVTDLMYASQQGDVQRVRRIIRRQPNTLDIRDRTGKTPLHYTAASDHVCSAQAADVLVMAAPDLVETHDEDGFTPLHLAVIAGNIPLVTFLLANGGDVTAVDNEKHTVVHWATVCGETSALRAVLAAGAPVSTPDVHGGFPLHYAAQMCGGEKESSLGLEVLQALLGHKGINVSVEDGDGRQPLLWAASAGSAKAVLALIKAGAAVETADKDGLTALHCAASRGHTNVIDILLTLCGASPDVIDSNGCTALHYAVTLGHADATALLLAHGADANRQDRKGRSPAHCGCAKGQFETVKMIAAQGANLWLRNARGDLPLHEAATSGRRDLVRWLLDMRPSHVNAKNNDGRCPLHLAAANDNADMCKILLDAGAQINPLLRTSRNRFMTPLDCALQRGFRSTAKYLQLHGGVPASRLGDAPPSINLQIRDDVTFRGGTSSDSERENGESKKIARKKRSSLGGEAENSRLLNLRKRPTKVDYTNEIVINGKTEINIHQGKVTSETSDKLIQVNDEEISEATRKSAKVKKEGNLFAKLSANGGRSKKVKKEVKKEVEKVLPDQQSIVSNTSEDAEQMKNLVVEAAVHEPPKQAQKEQKIDSEAAEIQKAEQEFVQKIEADMSADSKNVQQEEESKIEKRPEAISEEENQNVLEEVKTVLVAEESEVNKVAIAEESKLVEKAVDIEKEEGEKLPSDGVEGEIQKKHQGEPVETGETEKPISEETTKKREEAEDPDVQLEEFNQDLQKKETDANLKKEEQETYKQEATEVQDEFQKSKQEATEDEFQKLEEEEIQKKTTTTSKREKESEEGEKEQPTSDDTGKEIEHLESSEPQKEESAENLGNQKKIKTKSRKGEKGIPDTKTKDLSAEKLRKEESAENLEDQKESKTRSRKGENETSDTKTEEAEDREKKTKKGRRSPDTKTEEEKDREKKTKKGRRSRRLKKKSDPEEPTIKKDKAYEIIYKTLAENEEIEIESSSEVDSDSSTPKQHKSFRVLNDKEAKDLDNHKRKIKIKKQRSRSEENLQRPKYRSKIPTLSKSDRYLHLPERKTKSSLESRVPSLPNIPAPASVYSDESEEEDEERKKKKPKRKTKRGSKSAGSDYESSNVMDSGFEPSPRSSRIPRWKNVSERGVNMTSVTQSIQTNIRRYHLERKIFQHLLDLKRLQIRAGQHNEALLVKRAIDSYHQSCASTVGAGRYLAEDLTFKSFEKFLYTSLRKLQKNAPEYLKGLPEAPSNPLLCTQSTHRCMHATHAYTGVPCAAYLPKMDHHTIPKIGFTTQCKPEGFLPTINKKAVTLELVHGGDKQVISLPTDRLDQNKRYYVTFTVKGNDESPRATGNEHRHSKSD